MSLTSSSPSCFLFCGSGPPKKKTNKIHVRYRARLAILKLNTPSRGHISQNTKEHTENFVLPKHSKLIKWQSLNGLNILLFKYTLIRSNDTIGSKQKNKLIYRKHHKPCDKAWRIKNLIKVPTGLILYID